LAATLAVEDHARRQTPAILSGSQRFQDKLLFHVLRLTGSQNGIAVDVADLAKVVKAFAGSDITDVAGQNLKRPFYFKPLRQVLIPGSARFSAVCQRPLSATQVVGFQAFVRHDALYDRVGCRIPVAPENTADTVGPIDALTFIKNRYDLLTQFVAGRLPPLSVVKSGVKSGCGNAKFFGPLRLGVFGFVFHQVIKIRHF
jgi:hypothetical protein